MKLESLKSSKFEAFKGSEVKNPLAVTGGAVSATTWQELGHPENHGTDTWSTGDGATKDDFVFHEKGDITWSSRPPEDIMDPMRYHIGIIVE